MLHLHTCRGILWQHTQSCTYILTARTRAEQFGKKCNCNFSDWYWFGLCFLKKVKLQFNVHCVIDLNHQRLLLDHRIFFFRTINLLLLVGVYVVTLGLVLLVTTTVKLGKWHEFVKPLTHVFKCGSDVHPTAKWIAAFANCIGSNCDLDLK